MPSPNHNIYQSPLAERYASAEMLYNFSANKKFRTWRTIWIALAEAEKELGLAITQAQINELKKFRDRINYNRAEKYEQSLQHDVMAHIRAYGDQCPKAKSIIHLGATSALVVDNTDLIITRDGIKILKQKLIDVIEALARFAEQYKSQPVMGFTHFQPALITTAGKRTTLWLQDLLMDLSNLEFVEGNIKCLGAKGAIGTQASFLRLFNNNTARVRKLDQLFTRKLGFNDAYPVTGQTYSRKLDYQITSVLSGIAQSIHKFSNDLRLLQGLGEMSEPFGTKQVGSSAMAYKRNPMKSERLAALARFVIVNTQNTAFTAAQQWLERTLDDSANKRLVIPEVFLATDALLGLYLTIAKGLKVSPAIIQKHIDENLPFLITEQIMMEKARPTESPSDRVIRAGSFGQAGKGSDRQALHERVRQLSMEAVEQIMQGKPNDLITRMRKDPLLSSALPDSINAIDYIGLAKEQTEHFLKNYVKPILRKK